MRRSKSKEEEKEEEEEEEERLGQEKMNAQTTVTVTGAVLLLAFHLLLRHNITMTMMATIKSTGIKMNK